MYQMETDMTEITSRSLVAKLLANEDISVTYGNYPTAWFDVEQRELGLPQWKVLFDQSDKGGKDLADLLIGHEVGHALYTPADGWHDSQTEIPDCPRSYINVIEDIRIEKLVQRKYPGLVNCFKKGYGVLNKRNFFGTEGRDLNTYNFIDRLNLKTKLRDLTDVPFSAEEQPYYDMALRVETWEDVIEACKAIHQFMQDQQDPNQEENSDDDRNFSMDDQDAKEDFADSSQGDENDSSQNQESMDNDSGPEGSEESGKEDESPDGMEQDSSPSEKDDDREGKTSTGGAGRTSLESETDKAFRSKENELIETDYRDNQPIFTKAFNKDQIDEIVVPYSKIAQSRKAKLETFKEYLSVEIEMEYHKFQAETRKATSLLVKDFELRKAAYRTLRAQTARTGSIDVNKLHSYKYNDDIFAKVTSLADAKSHGMIMVIDYSGSMHGVIGDVIKQTLNLVTFCKRVNIPFQVYGFTTTSAKENIRFKLNTGDIDYSDVIITDLINSEMKKAEFEEAYKGLYNQTADYRYWFASEYESMGGTPLIETLVVMNKLVDSFKRKYNIQKTNLVMLTDGHGSPVRVNSDQDRSKTVNVDFGSDKVLAKSSRDLQVALMDRLRNKGVRVIGFFLAERNYDFRGAIWNYSKEFVTTEKLREYMKAYRKEKFIAFDDTQGYDRVFVLKADKKALDTENEELEFDKNATKNQIKKAFTKHTSSKKGNRILSAKFAEIVAA